MAVLTTPDLPGFTRHKFSYIVYNAIKSIMLLLFLNFYTLNNIAIITKITNIT